MFRKNKLEDIELNICKWEDVKLAFDAFLHCNGCHNIMFLNLYAYSLSKKDRYFKEVLNQSQLLLNDGLGISMLCKKAGFELFDNNNGTDLIPDLLKSAPDAGVFLLGAKPGIAEIAGKKLESSGIKVLGTQDGFFSDSNKMVDIINESEAQILILGMGMPLQEKWLYEYGNRLSNVRVAFAGGAIIDYLSETIKRSPKFFINLKLEWLYRMIRQPGRLLKRNAFSIFYLLVGLMKIKKVR